MKVTGFSHVTIRVSDLDRSLAFYCDQLHMTLRHKGRTDAYLEWGNAWICLIQKERAVRAGEDSCGVDHVAFYIAEADFQEAMRHLQEQGIPIVRGPVKRGQGWSVNFLDPDGTQLELHTSTLDERMEVWV